ncbi:pseudouridine synthase [Wallemia mellicola CBS 633.66]|uniref:tRNA pseudouridine synthase n=1 Tax=Wallemia mellicola (strain ATCC MYA-4683 / CBS 633.66) TaxID=671144 RepID=I4YHX5_WALMC|nr:pseudouridine synthase [Wallemia mellicola CBS 633.66]EIM23567.1 pseudouridine synthase [Wallemia mellicola CBS 633.66]|eukprot:XP_006956243.1 pseudouridine synthase [Wallemia mellicola CBS 633.66]
MIKQSKKNSRDFVFNAYSQRKIAIKFSYAGWAYNGLAAQGTPTPLPTVEQTLWDALAKGRLVDSTKSFESAGWSRCGRTDKGVSSAGQVVALWVRSAYTPENKPSSIEAFKGPSQAKPIKLTKDQQALVEYNFLQILNSLLPPTIRILAWSPVKNSFDARFDCKERHYKYYFDIKESPLGPGLDIHLMNGALELIKGEHDFRNFCKVDASKQIKNFHRRINDAWIDPPEAGSNLHCVNLRGSAFLYHQVRCIMAVLFLVGCGREKVEIINDLMRVKPDDKDPSLPVVEGKPLYDMANDLPLCLYDCVFDERSLSWRTQAGDEPTDEVEDRRQRTNTSKAIVDQLYELELQSAMLKNALSQIKPIDTRPVGDKVNAIPLGGNNFVISSKHLPLLERERGDTPDVINARWRDSEKGKRRSKKSTSASEKMDISDAE